MPNNPYLLIGLHRSAEAVAHIIPKIHPAKYDLRTDPDRFTLREAIAHLADWEPVMRGRILQAANNPGSDIPNWDEEQMALDNAYNEQGPVENAQKLLQERQITIKELEQLSPEQWLGTVTHPNRGTMTAYDWANTTLGHDLYHIEHFVTFVD